MAVSTSKVLRLGLCCLFSDEPTAPHIKFRSTTVTYMQKLKSQSRDDQLRYVQDIIVHNVKSLGLAIQYCAAHSIGCFRVNSFFFPVCTHNEVGYHVSDLPKFNEIREGLLEAGALAKKYNLRLAMHPDQFVVLNSQKEHVVELALKELEYQAELAQWIGVDVINIHGGGAFGDKKTALEALIKGIGRLSERAKSRLTLENDDKTYTPEDLLPVCHKTGVPLVYDVHHHRCTAGNAKLTDKMILETTLKAAETWNGRPPLLHISSPKEGWEGPKTNIHHDFIDYQDFPECWKHLEFDWTLEVEARKKEVAINRLIKNLQKDEVKLWNGLSNLEHLTQFLTEIKTVEEINKNKKGRVKKVNETLSNDIHNAKTKSSKKDTITRSNKRREESTIPKVEGGKAEFNAASDDAKLKREDSVKIARVKRNSSELADKPAKKRTKKTVVL